MDGLGQGIIVRVRPCFPPRGGAGHLPADDVPGKHVDDEDHIDEPLCRRHNVKSDTHSACGRFAVNERLTRFSGQAASGLLTVVLTGYWSMNAFIA